MIGAWPFVAGGAIRLGRLLPGRAAALCRWTTDAILGLPAILAILFPLACTTAGPLPPDKAPHGVWTPARA